MTTKIAINGYGRIGRCFHRALTSRDVKDLELVAINDITDPQTLAHLLKFDSVHGVFDHDVKTEGDNLIVDGKAIRICAERDPANLPWKELGVEYVIESTGLFRDKAGAGKHISAGAKKVVISAPAKEPDAMFVMGVNNETYDPSSHNIISNASCTTNCLAPLAKVIHDSFGIVDAQMTTIHSYTNDQRILDLPHKDLRRARAAAESMIPTTTGAARAVGVVLPDLNGKIDGMSIRVPTSNVSIVELTANTKKATTVEEVNAALKKESETNLKGILGYEERPLVSVDFNGDPRSSIVDPAITMMIGSNNLKVFSWYDNEWGYSNRLIDISLYMISKK